MNSTRWVILYLWMFVLVHCPASVHAQAWGETLGARSTGMNNTSVALRDFWSLHNNPAGISDLHFPAVGINYASRFSMKELSTKTMAVIYPVQKSVLALDLNYFGYALYHEMKVGLAYGRRLGRRISAGIQLDYLSVVFGEQYGSHTKITFGVGVQYEASDDLTMGAYVYNPLNIRYDTLQSLSVPFVFKTGIAYSFSDQLLTTVEIEKNSLLNYWNVSAGAEYLLKKHFAVRVGTGLHQEVFSFGLGYQWKNLTVDLASTVHQQLGLTTQFSIFYTFRK